MSATVSITTTPYNLSPLLNSPSWFVLNTTSSTASNFKYIVTLFKEPEPFINVFDELQTYKLPPRPFGECEYSPSKMLESFFGYKPTPYILGWTQSENALIRYKIQYGYEFNPNVAFQSTSNLFGDLVLQTLATFTFSVGDIIRIDKDNKQVNPGYDGLATVTAYSGGAIRTNLSFGITQSNESGRITSIQKIGGTSSAYDGFYGTRQYNNPTEDYSVNYIIATGSQNRFLTNWKVQIQKPVLISDWETLSLILDETTGYSLNVEAYTSTGVTVSTYKEIIGTSSNHLRNDVGVGPANVVAASGNTSFFNTTSYYDAWIEYEYALNLTYSTATYSFPQTTLYPNGFYLGYPYWTWNDGFDTIFLWHSTPNSWWEFSSALGGGNQWSTSTNDGLVPPDGVYGGEYLPGIDAPFFSTLELEMGEIVSEIRRYRLDPDCNVSENVRLVWLNSFGGWDYFNFKVGGKQSINVERQTYKKLLARDYSIGDRGDTTYAQKAEETWSIQSNWITEAESEWLVNLIQSREVYELKNGDIYPIQILDTSYQVKQSIRDMIFNLSIQFKYAFNRVI
jgi:hypothetical protein